MNESVIRSPKWLRKFVDFEVSTGEDIKDNILKRSERKKAEAEDEEKKKLNDWDRRWNTCDEEDFNDFYKEEFHKTIWDLDDIRKKWRGDFELWHKFDTWKKWNDEWIGLDRQKFIEFVEKEITHKTVWSSDLEDIRKKWKGNYKIFDDFKAWEKKKFEKDEEQKKIEKELDDLFDRFIDDFKDAPYNDKFTTISGLKIDYVFENGDKFSLDNNKIRYGKYTYTVNILIQHKFLTIIATMIKNARKRPSSSGYNPQTKSYKTGGFSNHPKGGLYQTLKDTVKQREEQLNKMPKNHPDRASLENELRVAKQTMKNMNVKYHFENLMSFSDYTGYDSVNEGIFG